MAGLNINSSQGARSDSWNSEHQQLQMLHQHMINLVPAGRGNRSQSNSDEESENDSYDDEIE